MFFRFVPPHTPSSRSKVPRCVSPPARRRRGSFQAGALTRGGVPEHNETFGREIHNLTERIKAERAADARGGAAAVMVVEGGAER